MNEFYGSFGLDSHGGECCGVHHLYDFEDETDFEKKPTLADKIRVIEDELTGYSTTIEVVLTRQQAKVWERALYGCRFKFKRVMEFSNPNTSNILRMYLSTNNQIKPVRGKK